MKKSYHFIGIGGIGMSGLARLLLRENIQVTGSDLATNRTTEELVKEGATIYKGHSAIYVPSHATVVYSSDIKEDNPEYQAALKMSLPLLHRADLLAELLKERKALAVAGTHGKTTTSSLLATVCVDGGLDPSCAIGGILPGFGSNARFGKGEFFVLEADESDRSFLKYHPFGAIVTNIGRDHLINYNDSFECLIDSFKLFMEQVSSPDHLFWCRDDVTLAKIAVSGQTYGFHPESDWKVISMRQEGFRTFFDLEHEDRRYLNIELALAGRHNVLNGTAVFGLGRTLGISEERIRHSFKEFKGVLRRCEYKGSCRDVHFYDDYAHHPTEIRTTLHGIRQAIGSKRLIVVFQPHRYSRTQECLGSYKEIFDLADELMITDIYSAGERVIPGLSSETILDEVAKSSSLSCRYLPRKELSHFLSQFVSSNDIVVTLGAGDITALSRETLELLEHLNQIHPVSTDNR